MRSVNLVGEEVAAKAVKAVVFLRIYQPVSFFPYLLISFDSGGGHFLHPLF